MRRRRREEAPAPEAPPLPRENAYPPHEPLSPEGVEAIHAGALDVLARLGIRVLLAEAREMLAAVGATLDGETVRMPPALVEALVAQAPRAFTLRARDPAFDVRVGGRSLAMGAGAGCPNMRTREGGRVPGTLAGFEDAVRLMDGFEAIAKLSPCVEPQDVPDALRHLAIMRAQLTLSAKPPFVNARGGPQVAQCFALIRAAHGLDEAGFEAAPRCYTVVNTNSPRTLDATMARGLIDFARAGQVSVVTPFCLAGAMAPVGLEGALTLSHAEALFGIALAQAVRPRAPVVYGAFASNVDLRSGAPAFGTPEHMRASMGAGQLARHVGLPWRAGAGTGANASDAQAAAETLLAVTGAVLGGANLIYHAAGWLEGGLTFGFEKMVTDMDALEALLLSMRPIEPDMAGALADIEAVEPGGHFFAAPGTLAGFRDAFHEPRAADRGNVGQWEAAGCPDATARAEAVWRAMVATHRPPPLACAEALDALLARLEAEGGALPE